MTAATHPGRCRCGVVRYVVTAPVRSLCYCHCDSCRRSVGAPFVAWGTVDRAGFQVTQGQLTMHRSSRDVERGFCSQCGSSLTYHHAQRIGEIDFTLATLEEPSGLQPRMHLWVQDKLPWVRLDDGLPQYVTVPPRPTERPTNR